MSLQMQSWSVEVTQKSVKGAALAQEAFYASKTVSALQAEDYFAQNYSRQALLSQSWVLWWWHGKLTRDLETRESQFRFSQILKSVARYGLVNGLANSLMGFEFSGVLYAGGVFLKRGDITVLQLWRYALYFTGHIVCYGISIILSSNFYHSCFISGLFPKLFTNKPWSYSSSC